MRKTGVSQSATVTCDEGSYKKGRMKDTIREFLKSQLPADEVAEFSNGDSLLEAGIIDSMTMVDLIAFLEEEYAITIGEDDMVPENFDSVDSIATYVEGKRAT